MVREITAAFYRARASAGNRPAPPQLYQQTGFSVTANPNLERNACVK